MDPNQMQALVALLSGGGAPQQSSLSSPGSVTGTPDPGTGTGGTPSGGWVTPGESTKNPKPDPQQHQSSSGSGYSRTFSRTPVYDKDGNLISTPVYNHGELTGYMVTSFGGGTGDGHGGGDGGKGGGGGDNTDPTETPEQLKRDRLFDRINQRSILEGPTGYGSAIQQNLGMDKPTVGYGGGLNHTSGMTNFMDLFTGNKKALK